MEIINYIKMLNFTSIIWQIMTPLIFSFADIISGYIQAVINHNVDSQKMRSGLWHKTLIVLLLILSFILELTFGISYISKIVSIYIIIMEVVSILENMKKAGIDLGRLGDILKEKTDIDTKESVNKLVNKIDKIVKTEDIETDENQR